MNPIYTDALVAELNDMAVKNGSITFAMAEDFANEHNLKVRSVVAKVKSLKLPYEPKPTRVAKTGEPVIHKVALVAAIEVALNVKVPSLEKATKEDLVRLFAALPADAE